MTESVPLVDLLAHRELIGDEIDRRMADVVGHGRWIMGPEVGEFEAAVGSYLGREPIHAIACGNGTDALVLALQALGLEPGQAVICPSFTFVATAEAIALLGGVPVFAEVEPDGFNLSAASVRDAALAARNAGLDVGGVCAVDLFGLPADYDELLPAAEQLGCWLMADGAQSFGARYGGSAVGALVPLTTTSFFPTKPLGCYGDGGMVMTTDPDLAELLISLRSHGKGSGKYDNVRIGQNSRLDTLQAAILLPKLRILDDELAARRRVAARYSAGLDGVVGIPRTPAGSSSAWAQYTITTNHRDALRQALAADGITTAVYYPAPLHRQPGYQHFADDKIDLSRTETLTETVLSLPMHPYLSDAQIDRVVDSVRTHVG